MGVIFLWTFWVVQPWNTLVDEMQHAVVIGDVSGEVGNGSVVIGATDDRGNTILNQPMAVGRDAKAGRGSIAIGAGASAALIANNMK